MIATKTESMTKVGSYIMDIYQPYKARQYSVQKRFNRIEALLCVSWLGLFRQPRLVSRCASISDSNREHRLVSDVRPPLAPVTDLALDPSACSHGYKLRLSTAGSPLPGQAGQ